MKKVNKLNFIVIKLIFFISLLGPLLWGVEVDDPILLKTFNQHEGDVFDVVISKNQKYFVSVGEDRTIRIWDFHARSLIHTIKDAHKEWVHKLAISADDRWVASAGCDLILSKNNKNRSKNSPKNCDKSLIKIWKVPTGRLVRTLEGHDSAIWSLSFFNQSKFLLSGGQSRKIKLWDVEIGFKVKEYKTLAAMILVLKKIPTKPHFMSSGAGGLLNIWNLEKSKPQNNTPLAAMKLGGKVLWDVDINESNYSVAAGGNSPNVFLGNLVSNKSNQIKNAHKKLVLSLDYSPNGRFLASAGCDLFLVKTNICQKALIKLWGGWKKKAFHEKQNITLLKTMTGHGEWDVNQYFDKSPAVIKGLDGIWDLDFSPDSRHLISAGRDQLIKLWDLEVLDILSGLDETNRIVVKQVYEKHQAGFKEGKAFFYFSPLWNQYRSPLFKQLYLTPQNSTNFKKDLLEYRNRLMEKYLSIGDLTLPKIISLNEVFGEPVNTKGVIQEESYDISTLKKINVNVDKYLLLKKYNDILTARANNANSIKKHLTIEAFKQMVKGFQLKFPSYDKTDKLLKMSLVAKGVEFSESVVFNVSSEEHARWISKSIDNLHLEVSYKLVTDGTSEKIVLESVLLNYEIQGKPEGGGLELSD